MGYYYAVLEMLAIDLTMALVVYMDRVHDIADAQKETQQ